jgi:tetratricopeptide (TPR) repeat protein
MRCIAFIFIVTLSLAFSDGCKKKPASEADANASTETAKESSFANITDPAAALAEGNRLLDDNQTEIAVEAYLQAVKLDPDLAEAHFKLGIAYGLLEIEMQQAGMDPNSSADTDPKKAGQLKTNSQKEFEKAVEAYEKWLNSHPKDDAAQFNLGRAYNKLNKDEEAEDAFREAVKLKPGDTDYQTELGSILIKLAKYHEAIPPLKKALELDPDNSRAEKLLDDAEAGAKRTDFSQADKSNKKTNANANANANVNANSSPAGNTRANPANADTRPRKVETRDKKGQPQTPRPN